MYRPTALRCSGFFRMIVPFVSQAHRQKRPQVYPAITKKKGNLVHLLYGPNQTYRLGDFLKESLANEQWTQFRAAVAFVKRSGVKHVQTAIAAFSARGSVRITVGVDSGGTSAEGMADLLDAVGPGELWVFHNENRSTFHPKIYLFRNDETADIVIGSGNLTEGGIFTNYEAGFRLTLDLANEHHERLLDSIESMLDEWCGEQEGLCYRVDRELLNYLAEEGYTPSEAAARETEEAGPGRRSDPESKSSRFKFIPVPAAPTVASRGPRPATEIRGVTRPAAALDSGRTTVRHSPTFLMTLQTTDVGTGQLTRGTSRRSPEIFIPLAARDHNPDFWGWPRMFSEDVARPGKMDRSGVRMLLNGRVVEVNMMTWPVKHDFRLRSEALRSASSVGDILVLRLPTERSALFDYEADVIRTGTPQHAELLGLCINPVRNSSKRWGYRA